MPKTTVTISTAPDMELINLIIGLKKAAEILDTSRYTEVCARSYARRAIEKAIEKLLRDA